MGVTIVHIHIRASSCTTASAFCRRSSGREPSGTFCETQVIPTLLESFSMCPQTEYPAFRREVNELKDELQLVTSSEIGKVC